MPAVASRPLLDHRLIIVTGKGGTGKTTIAAALSLAASLRGLRVVLAEVGPHEHTPGLFQKNPPRAGYAGVEIRPGLTVMRIDPFAALAEYLGLQLGVQKPVDMVLGTEAFRQFLEATPGWRELITLGKLWYLEQQRNKDGEPTFDLIVVDAPATGHGLTFLDVPRVAASAVRTGPLKQNSQAVEALIRDASRTLVLPVALAEELPARETAELARRVREDIGVAVDRIVVNGVAPQPFPDGLGDLHLRLARIESPGPNFKSLPSVGVLTECARRLAARHALNAEYVEQIAAETGLPIINLPYLDGGLRDPEDLHILARVLCPPEGEANRPLRSWEVESIRSKGAAQDPGAGTRPPTGRSREGRKS